MGSTAGGAGGGEVEGVRPSRDNISAGPPGKEYRGAEVRRKDRRVLWGFSYQILHCVWVLRSGRGWRMYCRSLGVAPGFAAVWGHGLWPLWHES